MSTETVLVTGASSGIGLELARCFAAEGCCLVLVSRKGAALETLASELRKAHKIQAQVITADLAHPDAPARLLAHLQSAGLRVDVLVNNAGFGAQGKFAELPLVRQLEMLQVNMTSLTHLTGLLLPGMIERRRGGILNVASTAAFQPGPGMAVYYATKAYVLSFTEALAEELAGTGLTVSASCPGPTATNFGTAANMHTLGMVKKIKMTAEEVARISHRAYRSGKVVAITGFRNHVTTFLVRLFPRAMVRKVTKRLNNVRYLLLLSALLAGAAAGVSGVASAQPAPTTVSESAVEKRACVSNLKAIYKAIEGFQTDHQDIPNWLSDLVPKYLDDPNVLVCPVCRRTGQTEAAMLADPKLPSSYLFEFCPVPLGKLATNAPTRTRREWKRRQMGLVGSQVPIVRCRYHKPALNLAFDGRVYESPPSWELLFTNRVSADDLSANRMFADVRPAAKAGKKKAPAGSRIPARSPDARKELLDLSEFYNAGFNESGKQHDGHELPGLPTGVQKFGGVEFDVRGIIQLGSKSPATVGYPVAVRSIPVRQPCQRLYFLHAARGGSDAEEGAVIGTYIVHFVDGQQPVKIPLRYGQELWDCHAPIHEASAPAELTVAWTAKDGAGKNASRAARLFVTKWSNPTPAQEIESIDFVSGVATAAPFLVAITAD